MKLKRGDKVKIIRGKDRGREGVISAVHPQKNEVLVEGFNVYKKHVKPKQNEPGGIIEVERPLPASNVMVICPKTGKPTRIGYTFLDGEKVRVCKVSGELLEENR